MVVLCVGLDETLEGEEGDTGNSDASGDKHDLHLPKAQEELIEKVAAVGKPTVVVLMAGSAIDMNYADENCNGILLAWYPGARGGKAVADLLFGKGFTFRKASHHILQGFGGNACVYRLQHEEPYIPLYGKRGTLSLRLRTDIR